MRDYAKLKKAEAEKAATAQTSRGLGLSKWQLAKMMAIPPLRMLATVLRQQDPNSTGKDDLFAGQLAALADSLEAWDGSSETAPIEAAATLTPSEPKAAPTTAKAGRAARRSKKKE